MFQSHTWCKVVVSSFCYTSTSKNYDVLLEYCKEIGARDPVAVFYAAKLESTQIKAALFVLNDILTELADLSRTFQKSDITPMEAQTVAYSKIAKLQVQYLGEHKHWSATVQDLVNKSTFSYGGNGSSSQIYWKTV